MAKQANETPIMLQIRTDELNNLVCAYLTNQVTGERELVATINRSFLASHPEVFERWKEALKVGTAHLLAKHGVKVLSIREEVPGDDKKATQLDN